MAEQQTINQASADLKKQARRATGKGGSVTPLLIFSAVLVGILIMFVAFAFGVRALPSLITADMLAEQPSLQTLLDDCQNIVAVFPHIQKVVQPVLFAVVMVGMVLIWVIYHIYFEKRIKKSGGAWYYPVLSGCITMLITIVAYMQIGMWPLGEKTAMIVDMHHQYAPLLAQLRDMLLNGGSVLYSFEVGYGTSFIPVFAYYMSSPFNIILTFFPQAYLAEGILLITVLKITLTGAFMTLCVQYIFKRRNFASVMIGALYALSMYMLAYSWDVMWLDCVMILPLCIMGFELMMRTGKYWLYVVSLAYILCSNYYIGFMICIFMVLYFFLYFFRSAKPLEFFKSLSGTTSLKSLFLENKEFVRGSTAIIRFTIGSLLGGGIAACILLPAFMSLGSTSAAGGESMEFMTYFNIFELTGRGFFGVEPTIRSGPHPDYNLPNIYCGVMTVLIIPIFMTLNSIPLRRRLSYLAVFGILSVSFVVKPLNLIWHGMHSPNDLPFRNSFLFSFLLLLMLYEVLYNMEDISPLQIGASILCIGIYMVCEQQFGEEGYSMVTFLVTFALILVYGFVFFLVSQKYFLKESAYLLLVIIVCGELMFNTGETLRQMNNTEHYTNHVDYLDNDTTAAVQATVDRMTAIGEEELDGDFFRMEFLPRRTTTDTALFDYRGITVFASSGSYNMTRLMGSMGYAVNGVNSVLYKSYVPTCDSLVGIKYVALEFENTTQPYLKFIEKVEVGDKSYYIHENLSALPIGFMVDEGVKNWNYSYYDPMSSQNSLFKIMTNTTENVMECLPIRATNTDFSSVNGTTGFSIDHNDQANVVTAVFKATIEKAGPHYIHVDCRAAESINASVGGNSWGITTYEPFLIDAGNLNVGDEVTVTVSTKSDCAGNVYVASLNNDVFDRDVTSLKDESLVIESFTDSNLRGTVNAENSGTLMTTIAYDDGWSVKVDGKIVPTYAVGEALLAFDLPAGEHTIELNFMPKGFILGVVLSVVSVICFIALCILSAIFWNTMKKRLKSTAPSSNNSSLQDESEDDSERRPRNREKQEDEPAVKYDDVYTSEYKQANKYTSQIEFATDELPMDQGADNE